MTVDEIIDNKFLNNLPAELSNLDGHSIIAIQWKLKALLGPLNNKLDQQQTLNMINQISKDTAVYFDSSLYVKMGSTTAEGIRLIEILASRYIYEHTHPGLQEKIDAHLKLKEACPDINSPSYNRHYRYLCQVNKLLVELLEEEYRKRVTDVDIKDKDKLAEEFEKILNNAIAYLNEENNPMPAVLSSQKVTELEGHLKSFIEDACFDIAIDNEQTLLKLQASQSIEELIKKIQENGETLSKEKSSLAKTQGQRLKDIAEHLTSYLNFALPHTTTATIKSSQVDKQQANGKQEPKEKFENEANQQVKQPSHFNYAQFQEIKQNLKETLNSLVIQKVPVNKKEIITRKLLTSHHKSFLKLADVIFNMAVMLISFGSVNLGKMAAYKTFNPFIQFIQTTSQKTINSFGVQLDALKFPGSENQVQQLRSPKQKQR